MKEQILKILRKNNYPDGENDDDEMCAEEIINLIRPVIEQNRRIRDWFKHRTGLDTEFMQGHMMKIDDMLHNWYPKDFMEWLWGKHYVYDHGNDKWVTDVENAYEYWLKNIKK